MISANTLFHFTPKFEFLKSILQHGVYVRYSLEDYGSLEVETEAKRIGIPMACFCDIPLSQIADHVETYGEYSVGFSKSWGMKNGISPVIYTYSDSYTSQVVKLISVHLNKVFDIGQNYKPSEPDDITTALVDLFSELFNAKKPARLNEKIQDKVLELISPELLHIDGKLSHLVRYMKPYQGHGFSNGNEISQKVFYNEREWRYVPSKSKVLNENVAFKDSISEEVYLDPRKRRSMNMKIAKSLKLKFQPEDISYIIVSAEREIVPMIRFIDNNLGNIFPMNKIKLLHSKIISLEKIKSDF